MATYKKQKSSKSDDFEDFWQATPFWIFVFAGDLPTILIQNLTGLTRDSTKIFDHIFLAL